MLPQGWDSTTAKTRLNNFTNAFCQQGNITLKREWRSPSKSTADSTHRDKAHRSSDVVNGLSKTPGTGEGTEIREPPHDICMERRIKRTRRPSSNRHEMRHCSRGSCPSGPTDTMCLVTSGLLAESVSNFSGGSAWVHPGKIGNTILPMRPERILATPDSPMEIRTAVSRILGPPQIPPRTIACHTRCETLLRPPNWLPAGEGADVEKVHAAGEW